MGLLGILYEKVKGRPAPRWLRVNSAFVLVGKLLRKWLCVSVIPFIPFNAIRVSMYRCIGFQIGRRVHIGMQCYLDDMYPKRMIIEDDVGISYRVTFALHGPRTRDNLLIIRKGTYVGCNATLMGGSIHGNIEIGPNATVGTCALVTKSVPPFATVAGVPAKVIRIDRPPWEGTGNWHGQNVPASADSKMETPE